MNYFDSVDWNAVGSIGSAISALVAILVLWITARGLIEESKKSRESFRQSFLMNSANMITTFESTYYGDRGTKDRKRASTALLTIRNKNKDREFANSTDVFDLYDVGTENFSLFSLFENIGYLTRIGVLDREMVYENFFWEIEKYYIAVTKPHNLLISTRVKEQLPPLWKEFEWLYLNLLETNNKENYRPVSNDTLTEAQITEFLVRECEIDKS